MFRLPLTVDDFTSALTLGLGRALLHVREFGCGDVLQPLLEASLRNPSYDQQVDGHRADWMIQFYDRAHEGELLAQLLPGVERSTEDDPHQSQRARLCFHLARHGWHEAHTALYAAWRRSLSQTASTGTEELLALDGAQALRWMLGLLRSHPVEWDGIDTVMFDYDELFGAGAARPIVEAEWPGDVPAPQPPPRKWSRTGWRAQQRALCRLVSGQQINSIVASGAPNQATYSFRAANGQSVSYRLWGELGSPAERAVVFQQLLQETEPLRLCKYLRVFNNARTPRVDPRVVELTRHRDPEIRALAFKALGHHRHSTVRALALETAKKRVHRCNELCLWIRNYQPGDMRVLRRVMKPDRTLWQTHRVVSDLLKVAQQNPHPEMVEVLLFIYEALPCLNCREDAVDELRKREAMPAWAEEEFAWGAQAFRYQPLCAVSTAS